MLKRQNRLTSKFQYNITKKYGIRVSGNYADIYALEPKNGTCEVRVGIIISSKFSKKAVRRNRIRRLFRESTQHNLHLLPKNIWIVVYPKIESIGKTYEEINSDFINILQKISFSK